MSHKTIDFKMSHGNSVEHYFLLKIYSNHCYFITKRTYFKEMTHQESTRLARVTNIKYIGGCAFCSVSTGTWQLAMCWWQRAGWWKLVTLGWPGTSTMTPTMSWEETYVQCNLTPFITCAFRDIFFLSMFFDLLSFRCVCQWSGWHQRASFRGCTPWRVTCGLMASCCGRSSHSVPFTNKFS